MVTAATAAAIAIDTLWIGAGCVFDWYIKGTVSQNQIQILNYTYIYGCLCACVSVCASAERVEL